MANHKAKKNKFQFDLSRLHFTKPFWWKMQKARQQLMQNALYQPISYVMAIVSLIK